LAKIQALSAEGVANATTDASQLRKTALIQSGNVGVGKELGFDQTWIDAAQQNPESEWAQLQREYAQRQRDLIEAESAQNLLYSGDYVRQLNELAQGKASAEGAIGSRLRDMLSGIDTNLLSAQETARQQELDAATQAAMLRAGYGMLGGPSMIPDGLGGFYSPSSGDGSQVVWLSMPDGSGMRQVTQAEADQINAAWWAAQGQSGPALPPTNDPVSTILPADDPLTTYLAGTNKYQ